MKKIKLNEIKRFNKCDQEGLTSVSACQNDRLKIDSIDREAINDLLNFIYVGGKN